MRRREYIAGGVGLAAVVAGGVYVTLGDDGPGHVSSAEVDLLDVGESPTGTLTVPATDRYTVLDLFSYTCLACPPQMDNLRTAKAKLGETAQFVSLHPVSLIDDLDDPAPVFEFWEKHGGPWPVALDPDDHFHEAFNNPSHPHTAVLDPEGHVVWSETGKTPPSKIVDTVEGQ